MRSEDEQAQIDRQADTAEILGLRANLASVQRLADDLEAQAARYAAVASAESEAAAANCRNCFAYKAQARQLRQALSRARVVPAMLRELPQDDTDSGNPPA